MHTRRTKLKFSVNFLCFGFKVEDFVNLRHMAAGTATVNVLFLAATYVEEMSLQKGHFRVGFCLSFKTSLRLLKPPTYDASISKAREVASSGNMADHARALISCTYACGLHERRNDASISIRKRKDKDTSCC